MRLHQLTWTKLGTAIIEAPPVRVFVYSPARCLLIGHERPKHMPIDIKLVRVLATAEDESVLIYDTHIHRAELDAQPDALDRSIREAQARGRGGRR